MSCVRSYGGAGWPGLATACAAASPRQRPPVPKWTAKYDASAKTPMRTAKRPSRSRKRSIGGSILGWLGTAGAGPRGGRHAGEAVRGRAGLGGTAPGRLGRRISNRGAGRFVPSNRVANQRPQRFVPLDVAEHHLEVLVDRGVDQEGPDGALA